MIVDLGAVVGFGGPVNQRVLDRGRDGVVDGSGVLPYGTFVVDVAQGPSVEISFSIEARGPLGHSTPFEYCATIDVGPDILAGSRFPIPTVLGLCGTG